MTSVSVVIPAHNSEQWIVESLESVFAQTRQPEEVIVVNDASTDGTEKRVRSFFQDVHIIQTSYRNAAAARNAGVRAARGDCVAFLDADDIWYPHHLERAIDMLSHSEDVAYLAHNDQDRYHPSGSVARVQRNTEPPVRLATHGLAGVEFFKWWARKAWFFTGTCVVNRRRFLAISGFDESQIRRHDFEMFMRLVCGRTWSYNPEPSCLYRFLLNADAISSNELETTYYTLKALKKNQELYDCHEMANAIAQWSSKLCIKSIREGSNAWISKDIDPFAAVPPIQSVVYRCGLWQPRMGAYVYGALRAIKNGISG